MNDNDEARLAVGKKADDLGLILTKIGAEYQLHSGTPQEVQPEFASENLAEVEEFLDQRVADR